MESDLLIRRMTLNDVDSVYAIELATFASPWSRDSFEKEMKDNPCARYLVAQVENEVIGFAGIWWVLEEGHITNIAISEKHRGKGYGKRLTEALLQYAANLMVQYVTLEVRRSNLRAQSLYKALGFVAVGYRKRYYEDNGEDALLMVNEHLPVPEENFSEKEMLWEA